MTPSSPDLDAFERKSAEERRAHYIEMLTPFLEPDGPLAGPSAPDAYGHLKRDNEADLAENVYLALSVRNAKDRFRLLSLGAAPGEWAIRAERLYRKVHAGRDYMSICVEADLGHIQIMRDFFRNNDVDQRKNVILFAAVADTNGWAYMPIIDSTNSSLVGNRPYVCRIRLDLHRTWLLECGGLA